LGVRDLGQDGAAPGNLLGNLALQVERSGELCLQFSLRRGDPCEEIRDLLENRDGRLGRLRGRLRPAPSRLQVRQATQLGLEIGGPPGERTQPPVRLQLSDLPQLLL
jgi:hypothetical protein